MCGITRWQGFPTLWERGRRSSEVTYQFPTNQLLQPADCDATGRSPFASILHPAGM